MKVSRSKILLDLARRRCRWSEASSWRWQAKLYCFEAEELGRTVPDLLLWAVLTVIHNGRREEAASTDRLHRKPYSSSNRVQLPLP